ncbi:hypothetical protein KR032_008430 [Drosophila birchii]|nr:hypothetical protein KR032_008430 [Drosophila birchii]
MLVIQRVLLFGLMVFSAWRFIESHKVRSNAHIHNYIQIFTFVQSLNFLVFRKITAEYNRKYISLYEVGISEDHYTINFTLHFARDITADVWLRATIAQRVSKDSYRDIFTYNVNLCQVMGRGKSLINYWLDNILRQSNMPRSCPLKMGNYYMSNIRSDKETIPRFIRSGSFRIDSNVYVRDWHNDNLTNTVFYVEIKMK